MISAGADVVVIGGGLVGSSLAYELVSAGTSTVLIDRHDPGRATSAGAGILSPETNQDPDPLSFAAGMAAARHYEALTARLQSDGIGDTGYAVTGSLLIAQREGDDPWMDDAMRLVQRRSPGVVEEIDVAEAHDRFPPLGPVRRALFNRAARRVDGRVLNDALRWAAGERGLRVVHSGVKDLVVDGAAGRITAVRTEDETLSAGAVVIAAGAWSGSLGPSLGLEIPVTPLKGQIVHLLLPGADSATWPIVQPVLGFYLVPWPGGRIACGGTMEAEAGFDDRPTAEGLRQLLRECLRNAPGLSQATVIETRVGSRPATPDGRPFLGRLPGWRNGYVATGHGAEGLLLGPYGAHLVAQLILENGSQAPTGDPLAIDVLEACSVSRCTRRSGLAI